MDEDDIDEDEIRALVDALLPILLGLGVPLLLAWSILAGLLRF